MTDHFDISTRGDTNSTRLAACAAKLHAVEVEAASLRAADAQLREALSDLRSFVVRLDDQRIHGHLVTFTTDEAVAVLAQSGRALSVLPVELLAQREREQAVIRAATEYRQVNQALDEEPSPHPDPLARTLLIEIGEQKRAALFAAVDGLGEAKGETNAVPS